MERQHCPLADAECSFIGFTPARASDVITLLCLRNYPSQRYGFPPVFDDHPPDCKAPFECLIWSEELEFVRLERPVFTGRPECFRKIVSS